jgi:hypothetical protein
MDPLVRDPSRLPLSHSYYDNALRVAVAIISNCGIRLQSGDGQFVVLDTLLINLDQVFERYIRNRHALHFHRIEYPQKGKVLPITLLEIPSRLPKGGASTSLWRQTMAQKSYW